MYNLIIVEDEVIVRTALVEYISKNCNSYAVCGAFSNGESALSYIREHHVDVVLTDIKMNKMDGLSLCHELHKNFPYCHTIIISGFSTFDYAKRALQYGVKDYLLKPIDFQELSECLATIRKTLDSLQPLVDTAVEDAALFFTELISGSISSPKILDDSISKLNLPFLPENSSGCILRISLSQNSMSTTWRYGMDSLPLAFTNILRMSLENTYVNNFLTTGKYYYYIVIFLKNDFTVSIEELSKNIMDLLHLDCNITLVCNFTNLTHLSNQKILEKVSNTYTSSDSDESTVITRIKEYINQNYYKDISRQEVADAFYFSTAYFSRLFKQKTGLNFIDYLTTVRIEKSFELLNSRTSIDEIARQVGYKSRTHFIYNFRQYTSMSPTEYRKQILKL